MDSDVRELARRLPDPARNEPPAGRLHLLRERFMEQITTDPTPETAAAPPVSKRRRRLVPALVGATMAFVVAVWLTSAFVLGVGRFWAGHTEAGDLLNRIALVAANSTDLPPLDQIRDDQYIYIETYGGYSCWGCQTAGRDGTETGVNGWVPEEPHRRQIWLSVDGARPGILRDESVDAGSDLPLETNSHPGLHSPTLRYLATLPTDPDLLLLKIYWENGTMGPSPQQEAFVTIGDLTRESIVPPDIARALYQAAARIPGVEVVDGVEDALGRPGIAIARTHAGIREELIFDRDTLQFLGERSVVTAEFEAPVPVGGSAADTPPQVGLVLASTAIVTRAIVDAAGEVPAG
jgi:hypothetical protein